jgi:peptidyl-prolyl cis-trans isomerase C
MKKVLLLVFVIAFAISCSKGGGKGDYVVKVDDVKITKEDLQVEMALLAPQSRQALDVPGGLERFVEEMARKESLYLEAKKRGVDNDLEVRKRLAYGEKMTLINYFLEKEVASSPAVTEKDMQDYYQVHKDDEFTKRDQVRYSRIVVKSEEDAKKAYDRIKAGEDFAKVASSVSVDKTSARSGGDMGIYHVAAKSKLDPEMRRMLLTLKKGEVSVPLPFQDGVYILKVTDIKGETADFEKVKRYLARKMTSERHKAAIDKLIESARKKHNVDINKEAVGKLVPPATPGDSAIPQAGHK